MHRRLIAVAVAALAVVLGFGLAPASAAPAATPVELLPGPRRLARRRLPAGLGRQPHRRLRRPGPDQGARRSGATTLVNLGCPGETTASLINGGSAHLHRRQPARRRRGVPQRARRPRRPDHHRHRRQRRRRLLVNGVIDFACVQRGSPRSSRTCRRSSAPCAPPRRTPRSSCELLRPVPGVLAAGGSGPAGPGRKRRQGVGVAAGQHQQDHRPECRGEGDDGGGRRHRLPDG